MNVFAPEENGNTFTRNSNCTFGGDLLTFSIKKPGNIFIIGISLQIFPYIPDQNLGENQNFETIIVNKDFKTLNEVTITIKAVPEYSYTISGSYTTDFGTLSPSRNHSSPGEFERLLQGVGCYIRSDHHPSPQPPAVFLDQAMSAISCADQCHTSSECHHGWAYQVELETNLRLSQSWTVEKAPSRALSLFNGPNTSAFTFKNISRHEIRLQTQRS